MCIANVPPTLSTCFGHAYVHMARSTKYPPPNTHTHTPLPDSSLLCCLFRCTWQYTVSMETVGMTAIGCKVLCRDRFEVNVTLHTDWQWEGEEEGVDEAVIPQRFAYNHAALKFTAGARKLNLTVVFLGKLRVNAWLNWFCGKEEDKQFDLFTYIHTHENMQR